MATCTITASNFYQYFSENMRALNLPVPSGGYDSFMGTMGAIASLAEYAQLYPNMPLSYVRAMTGMELAKLTVAAGISFYIGAAIGSSAVALGRSLGCGTSIADALALAREHGIYGTWLEHELMANPQFLRAAA